VRFSIQSKHKKYLYFLIPEAVATSGKPVLVEQKLRSKLFIIFKLQ